jgi:hypothetical protein
MVARLSMNGWTTRFADQIHPPRSLESGEIGDGAAKIWTRHIRDPIGAYMRSRGLEVVRGYLLHVDKL